MAHISTTIISNVDPFSDSFSFQEGESFDTLPKARWRSLWGNFGIVHFHAITKKTKIFDGGMHPQLSTIENLVEKECRWTPVLRSLGRTYLGFVQNEVPKLDTPDMKAKIRRAILQLARSYYEEIWQSLTTDEHLALLHLSKDRFIHYEHPGLEPLIRKGLVRFDPDLRLLNASFREFVRIVGERDNLQDEEAKRDNSLWGNLKWPMGVGFGTILLFLIVTQEALRAALPAVIALAPVLLRGLPELSGKIKA